MERTAPPRAVSFPAPDVEVHAWTSPWRRALPLWRHAAFALLFFGLAAAALAVRLDVQDLQRDLARNARLQSEATMLNERLSLEWSVRHSTAAMEALATELAMTGSVPMIPVERRR